MATTNNTTSNEIQREPDKSVYVVMHDIQELKKTLNEMAIIAESADFVQMDVGDHSAYIEGSMAVMASKLRCVTRLWNRHAPQLNVDYTNSLDKFIVSAEGAEVFFRLCSGYKNNKEICSLSLTGLAMSLVRELQKKLEAQVPEMYLEGGEA